MFGERGDGWSSKKTSWLNSSEVVKAKLCPEFTEASRVSGVGTAVSVADSCQFPQAGLNISCPSPNDSIHHHSHHICHIYPYILIVGSVLRVDPRNELTAVATSKSVTAVILGVHITHWPLP